MFPLYFHLDSNIGNKKSHRKYVVVQGGRRLSSVVSSTCILWLHKEWTRDSSNISIHSLTYAMHVDVDPPACCWCRLSGKMVVTMLGRQICMKRRWNWRKIFQKVVSSAIHSTPYSVQFDGSHDQISACNAIDLDMMHAVFGEEIGDKPLLYLSLYVRGPSIFQVLSTFSFK